MDCDLDDGDYLIIDAHLSVSHRCMFSTKHLMLNSNETFDDTIDAVLSEHINSTINNIVSVDNDESNVDSIKLEQRSMLLASCLQSK